MRRSICYIEPQTARAGQIATWRFNYTTSGHFQKGSVVTFDMHLKNNSLDWEVPSTDLSSSRNTIYMLLNEEHIPIKAAKSNNGCFSFIIDEDLPPGSPLTIVLGSLNEADFESQNNGNQCQRMIQRRKNFSISISQNEMFEAEESESFSIDIKGNVLKNIRSFLPSLVIKNKRFDVMIRFEDAYGNLTNLAPKETLIKFSYENIRENLNWNLFVPETGFVILPNLYFNEVGTYRIKLTNTLIGNHFLSSPIQCVAESNYSLFWGLLRGESEKFDSSENIESCLRYYRDEESLNFFSSSSHEDADKTSNDVWKNVMANVSAFNEDDRFVSILGFKFNGAREAEGLRQIVFTKDSKSIPRKKDSKTSSLIKLYKSHSQKDLISIPTLTNLQACSFNFEDFQPEYEKVVEIYSGFGCTELTNAEGNKFPLKGKENPAGTVLNALKQNKRFGFVAGGLDFDLAKELSLEAPYTQGATAILSEKYNRDSVLDALSSKRCYATSGAKIILEFFISNCIMGSELSTKTKPGLKINRHISCYVAGTSKIKTIEIIRNGEIFQSYTPNSDDYTFTYDDLEVLENCLLEDKEGNRFAFYYLRVEQIDGHCAWSSPIWIDLEVAS